MAFLNPYHLQIIVFALVNAIMGVSIFLVLSSGQLSLGSAGFMAVGAYTSAILAAEFELPLLVSILLGALAAGGLSLLIGLATTRLRGLYLAIVTLGFSEVIRVVILNMEITNGALGMRGIRSLDAGFKGTNFAQSLAEKTGLSLDVVSSLYEIVLLIVIILVILWGWSRLHNSKVGRAFDSIKADEQAALASGINVNNYKMLSFFLSSFVAGLGGALYAHVSNFISPDDFGFSRAIDNLLYTVFGGSNVAFGPVLGSLILTILPEFLRFLAEYRDTIYGILLILLMTFRPEGILSERFVKRITSRKKPVAKEKEEN